MAIEFRRDVNPIVHTMTYVLPVLRSNGAAPEGSDVTPLLMCLRTAITKQRYDYYKINWLRTVVNMLESRKCLYRSQT